MEVINPAILLRDIAPYNDWLVCIVSTKIHNEIKGVDILLDVSHPDFPDTHLKTTSLIRVGKLYTIPINFIEGSIGSLKKQTYNVILKNLITYIQSAITL